MNHPAKPAIVTTSHLHRLWLELVLHADHTGRIDMPLDDIAREAGLFGLDAAAMLHWFQHRERIERLPDGALRVLGWPERAGFWPPAAEAAHNEDTPHGST